MRRTFTSTTLLALCALAATMVLPPMHLTSQEQPRETPGTAAVDSRPETLVARGASVRTIADTPVPLHFLLSREFIDRAQVTPPLFAEPVSPDGLSVEGEPIIVVGDGIAAELQLTVVASAPGRYILEPLEVSLGEVRYATEPVLIEVADRDGSVPFSARWVVPQGTDVYLGQSVPIVLEAVAIDAFVFPDALQVRPPTTGLFEEVGGLGTVDVREIAGATLYTLPMAGFIVTPVSSGDVTVPAAVIEALGLEAAAPALTLSVAELPGRLQESGAVGMFEVSSSIDVTTVPVGATVEVSVVIDGVGNIPVLTLPTVSADGLVEVERSEESSVEPDGDDLFGYRGRRRLTVRFEPGGEPGPGGRVGVSVGAFAAINPISGEESRSIPRFFPVTVVTQAGAPSGDGTVRELPLLSVEELDRLRWRRFTELMWPFALFVLAPAAFGLVRLLQRTLGGTGRSWLAVSPLLLLIPILIEVLPPHPLNAERLTRARELMEEGRPAVAGVLYELEIDDHPLHAALHYNRGVLALQAGDAVRAVYHSRQAVRLAPLTQQFRDSAVEIQSRFALENQLPIPLYPREDLLLLALFVAWTGGWIVVSVRPHIVRSLALATSILILVVLSIALGWSARSQRTPAGVVRQEVVVRRIPDAEASPWISIEPATTVEIELSYDEFYLVRTASGVTGWIPQRAIRSQEVGNGW